MGQIDGAGTHQPQQERHHTALCASAAGSALAIEQEAAGVAGCALQVPASSARATSLVALYALLPVCKEAGRAHAGAHSLLDQGRTRGYALCAVQKGKTGQRTRRALYNKCSVRVHEDKMQQGVKTPG